MSHDPLERWIEQGPVRIRVLDRDGSGSPIVALHGLGGNAHEWDALAGDLSERRMVAVDLRGHGESDRADSYGLDDYVGDVESVLDALTIGPAVLVGHSLGAAIALSLLFRRPELVTAMVLVDLGPELPPAAVELRAARADRPLTFADPEAAFTSLRAADPYASAVALRHRVRHSIIERPDGTWGWRHDLRAHLVPIEETLGPLWTRWEATTAPTLLVRGVHSPFLPADLGARMVERRPAGRVDIVAIDHAAHNVPTDNPKAFGSAVRDWLESEFLSIVYLGGTQDTGNARPD